MFAALTCGHEHVAAEAARLLTRLWAPAAARKGAPTWTLHRQDRLQEEEGAQSSSPEDLMNAKSAKTICLGPLGRLACRLFDLKLFVCCMEEFE